MFKCESCGYSHEDYDHFPAAKDIPQRLAEIQTGDVYSDIDCPKCGALVFPVEQGGYVVLYDTGKPGKEVENYYGYFSSSEEAEAVFRQSSMNEKASNILLARVIGRFDEL